MSLFKSESGADVLGNVNYPLVGFNFMLRVECLFDLPCKAVHGISRENEYDYIQEGGVNDYVLMKRKPVSKPFQFTVERYALSDDLGYDPLQEGAEFALPLMLFVSNHAGNFGVTRRVFMFTGCQVISKEWGDLNSEQAGLVVDKTTIGYREMIVVSTFKQIELAATKKFKFGDKPTNKEYSGVISDNYTKQGVGATKGNTTAGVWRMPDGEGFIGVDSTGKNVYETRDSKSSARIDMDSTRNRDAKRLWMFPDGEQEKEASGADSKVTNSKVKNLVNKAKGTTPQGVSSHKTDIYSKHDTTRAREYKFGQSEGDSESTSVNSARKDLDSTRTGVTRLWTINAKDFKGEGGSARKDTASKKAMRVRKWKISSANFKGTGGSAITGGAVVAKGVTKKGARKWTIGKDDYRGNGVRSAAKEVKTGKPVKRSWAIKTGRTPSAVQGADTGDPAVRQWKVKKGEYKGEGPQSARQGKDNGDPSTRRWNVAEGSYLGKGERSAKKGKNTDKAEVRLWKINKDSFLGSGPRSAKKDTPVKK